MRIPLALIIILLLSITLKGQVTISGYALYGARTIEIYTTEAAQGYKSQKTTAYPGLDGEFSVTISCDEILAAMVIPTIGEKAALFLHKGDTVHINYADTLNGKFLLSGKASEVNEILNSYLVKYRDFLYSEKNCRRLNDPTLFVKCNTDRLNELSDYAKQLMLQSSHRVSEKFQEYLFNEIIFSFAKDNILFNEFYTYRNRQDSVVLPDSFWSFLDTLQLNNEGALQSLQYRLFLDYYLNNYLLKVKSNFDRGDTSLSRTAFLYDLAVKEYTGVVKCYIQAVHLQRGFKLEPLSKIIPTYQKFLASCGNSVYGNQTKFEFNKQFMLSPGKPAPLLESSTYSGDTFSLADLKGKTVFLDFWATWCTPCIMDIINFQLQKERLEEEYPNIVFVYISIDKDEALWRDAIEKLEIKGIHLRTNGTDSPISEDYNIMAIPQYYVLDGEGKIITSTPPRQNRELYEYLVELMKTQEK